MADENIDVVVTDKVSSSVSTKLKAIATDARSAGDAVKTLQDQLKGLSATSGLSRLQNELNKTSLAQQKLLTETNKTNASYFAAEAALNRAIAAEAKAQQALNALAVAQSKSATEQARLTTATQNSITATTQAATAQVNLGTAQTNNATAAQRLATAQQQTATATAQAQAATTRAATAATQAQTATQNLATASTRASTAQTQGATAAQRLATEQNKTAKEAANAAAASDRAAMAALRLQQAQERSAKATQTANSALSGYVKTAAGLLGAGFGAKAIIDVGDAYTTLQNKLVNVTESQAQVNELTGRLFTLANETRTGVDATTTAFARFDRSLKSMGKSQEDTLRLTETVNKALVVGGATAQEASSSLLQLSQAFNAGKLGGDEFRSVSENIPVVLDAVAKVMNVPINQVKKLAEESKITSEVMFKAFTAIQDQIDKKFGKTVPTVSQAMTVLKNSATQFFGELNKSTGFTENLSKAIIVLSQNLNILAGVAAVAGVALLVAFGPTLVGALTTATSATLAFTAALAANPFGLLAIGITAAIAAFTIWGDKIKLGENDLYTLQDAAKGVWESIKEGTTAAGNWISDNMGGALEWLKGQFVGMDTIVSDFFGAIGSFAKGAANFLIGYFNAAFQFVTLTWKRFPDIMQGAFNGVLNIAASTIELIVNYWQKGLKMITDVIAKFAPNIAESMNNVMDKMTLSIPRLETKGLTDSAAEIAGAVQDAFKKDYVGSIGDSIAKNALAQANARRAAIDAENGSVSTLRGAGKSTLGADTDEKAAKAAEKRATAMQKINAQLDNEINRMFQLQPQREAQAKFDQIEESLISKKIKLTDDEKTAIMGKITAIQQATQVQAKFDELYNEAVAPQRDYNATLEAAQKLLDMGAISQERYSGAVALAGETYKAASDPLYKINKDLTDQIALLKMLPREREIEQAVIQAQNDALKNKHVMNAQEIADLRERLKTQQALNGVSAQEASLYQATVGQRQTFLDQMTAMKNLLADPNSGFTQGDSMGQTSAMLKAMGIDTTTIQEQIDADLAIIQNYFRQLEQMKAEGFISDKTYSEARAQLTLQENQTKLKSWTTLLDATAQLQTSNIKELARIGKAAALAQAIINVYEGVTKAIAQGGIMGLATGAIVVANGMAAVAKIQSQGTGFKTGGYTGNGAVDEVAGNVHGQEFVFNAPATRRIGVANLEALQSGATSIQDNNTATGGKVIMMDFNINNTIVVQGSGENSSAEDLERATDAISKKTQADIMDSIRFNSTWQQVIKQAAS